MFSHDNFLGLPRKYFQHFFYLIPAFVLVLSLFIMESARYKNLSAIGDADAYQYNAARSYAVAEADGRFSAIGWTLKDNILNPIRIILHLLVAPSTLRHPVGHQLSLYPAILLFFLMLGWLVFRITRSQLSAFISCAFCLAIPGLFSPQIGWHRITGDASAGLFLASASLAFCHALLDQRRVWLIMAGALFGLACGYRAMVLGYGSLILFPFFIMYLSFGNSKTEILGKFKPRMINIGWASIAYILAGGGVILFNSVNMVKHYLYYWSSAPTSLTSFGSSYSSANNFIMGLAKDFLGPKVYIISFILLAIGITLLFRSKGPKRAVTGAAFCSALGVYLFTVYVLKLDNGNNLGPVLMIPLLLFLAIMAGFALASIPRKIFPVICLIAIVFIGYSFRTQFSIHHSMYTQAHIHLCSDFPRQKVVTEFHDKLGLLIANKFKRIMWAPFFLDSSLSISLRGFHSTGILPLTSGSGFFTTLPGLWESLNRDEPYGEKAADYYLKRAENCLELVVVLDVEKGNPRWIKEYYSIETIQLINRLSTALKQNKDQWTEVFSLDYPQFGVATGYLNTKKTRFDYYSALKNHFGNCDE